MTARRPSFPRVALSDSDEAFQQMVSAEFNGDGVPDIAASTNSHVHVYYSNP